MSAIEVIFIASSGFSLATGFSVVALNPRRPANLVFSLVTTLSAIWLLCVFMAMREGATASADQYGSLLFWIRMSSVAAAFLPWSFFLTKEALMVTDTSLVELIRRSWLWFFVSGVLAMVAISESFIPSDSTPSIRKYGIGYGLYTVALTTLCGLILFQAYGQMLKGHGIRQLETRFFLINSCFCTLAILAANTLGSRLNMPTIRSAGAFVIAASNALTIWSVFYHRVFDARQIFTSLVHRLSTLCLLAISLIVLFKLTSDSFSEITALLLSVILAGILSAAWHRQLRKWLKLDPTQSIAEPRSRIVEYARGETDIKRLIAWFESFLRDWCQTDLVMFDTAEHREGLEQIITAPEFAEKSSILRHAGFITPEILERRRHKCEPSTYRSFISAHNLGAILVAPKGSHTPSCVVALGRKHSLRPYTHPDLQILSELTELMDNILTHSRVAARTAEIEKMESAAMMSRGLAHDLNNLATPVSTFLLHMEGRVEPGTAEAEVLADAKHSIRVMQDYIRESLFFARQLVPNFQTLSSTELFPATIRVTLNRAQLRGVIIVAPDATEVRFRGDRVLLQRLMQNLVLNAIDASPRGGSITLSASTDGSKHIALVVTDEGPGIPPEILDRIFEPYFTTKDTGHEVRGMGLGLAICLKISDLHGGTLKVRNLPSSGAAFTATLPTNPEDIARSPATTPA